MQKIRIFLFLMMATLMSPSSFSQKRKATLAKGHEYVDLGLPSGTYWATCNIGAYSPSDFGVYFRLGQTTPAFLNKDITGKITDDRDISGKQNLDAASALWHGPWRTPTRQDWEELIKFCTWHYVSQQSHEGVYAVGPSGRSVFFPGMAKDQFGSLSTYVRDIDSDINMTNGFVRRKNVNPSEYIFKYWSSTLDSVSNMHAGCFSGFIDNNDLVKSISVDYLNSAFPIRPVVDGSIVTDDSFISIESPDDDPHPYMKPFKVLPGGKRNGHDYVDLGLPSGTCWATCNIGAHKPHEGGNFYAWGDDQVKRNYFLEEDSKVYGELFMDYSGSDDLDAARKIWGDRWRTPSEYEIQELIDKCNWTWSCVEGTYGYIVEGKNGNSIFIPAVGYRNGRKTIGNGSDGYLWSSTSWNYFMFNDPSPNRSSCLAFSSTGSGPLEVREMERECGLAIRPVFTPEGKENVSDEGEVIFDSYPQQAHIIVDHAHFGRTPFKIRGLAQGNHHVLLYKPNYSPYAYSYHHRRNESDTQMVKLRLDCENKEQPDTLFVNCLPEGSEVYLDDKFSGTTPCSITEIEHGNHTLSIYKDGYYPTQYNVFLFRNNLEINTPIDPLVSSNLKLFESGYVDLGLPSGTLWAANNIGAVDMKELGSSVATDNLAQFHPDINVLVRPYNNNCSLPTIEQWKELDDNCKIVQVRIGEKIGRIFTGPNENSIFIPLSKYLSSDVEYLGSESDSILYSDTIYTDKVFFSLSPLNDNYWCYLHAMYSVNLEILENQTTKYFMFISRSLGDHKNDKTARMRTVISGK